MHFSIKGKSILPWLFCYKHFTQILCLFLQLISREVKQKICRAQPKTYNTIHIYIHNSEIAHSHWVSKVLYNCLSTRERLSQGICIVCRMLSRRQILHAFCKCLSLFFGSSPWFLAFLYYLTWPFPYSLM